MEIKVDKVFVTVLIVSLLFGNLLYMWGLHIGRKDYEREFSIHAHWSLLHNHPEINKISSQFDEILGDLCRK